MITKMTSRCIEMARLRVKTAIHPKTGKVYAELYYPDDQVVPIAITEPIYPNSEEAVRQSIEMFKNWMSLLREELEDGKMVECDSKKKKEAIADA